MVVWFVAGKGMLLRDVVGSFPSKNTWRASYVDVGLKEADSALKRFANTKKSAHTLCWTNVSQDSQTL